MKNLLVFALLQRAGIKVTLPKPEATEEETLELLPEPPAEINIDPLDLLSSGTISSNNG